MTKAAITLRIVSFASMRLSAGLARLTHLEVTAHAASFQPPVWLRAIVSVGKPVFIVRIRDLFAIYRTAFR
jgi:hypothetical protein